MFARNGVAGTSAFVTSFQRYGPTETADAPPGILITNARVLSVHAHGVGVSPEAIRDFRELWPDLLFLDVQMSEIDGFDVVDSIGPDQMPAVILTPEQREGEESTVEHC